MSQLGALFGAVAGANLGNNTPPPDQEGTVSAQVVIGQVTNDQNNAAYQDSGDDVAIYTDYYVHNRFEKDGHVWMLGLSSPEQFQGQSVGYVQTESPTLLWICDWTASRFSDIPDVPDPSPPNQNWILLDDFWEMPNLELANNGNTQYYRITGTYVYGHKNPSQLTINDIFFGKPAWMSDGFTRVISTSSLKGGISAPISTGAATAGASGVSVGTTGASPGNPGKTS